VNGDEYTEFVLQLIVRQKRRMSKDALLCLADDVVNSGSVASPVTPETMLYEVDKLLFKKLNIPDYRTWRRGKRQAGSDN
jgi:hypothetical protein